MNWLTCLSNVKTFIGESGTSYDVMLEQYIQIASDDIERYCDRKLRERTYGENGLDAEYHNGDGCKYIYTKEKPILSIAELYDDPNNEYGADTLIANTDYHIFKDIGKILLLGGLNFQCGNANIKINYTAGYGTFDIIMGRNDKLDFNESVGGTEITLTLTPGTYTGDDLATQIKTQFDDSDATGVYTVVYNHNTAKYTIKSTLSYEGLLWATGKNAHRSVGRTIGFDCSSNDAGNGINTYTSDYGVLGIPGDLELACQMLVARYFYASKRGKDRFDIKGVSESSGTGTGTTTFMTDHEFPVEVARIIPYYRRLQI